MMYGTLMPGDYYMCVNTSVLCFTGEVASTLEFDVWYTDAW